MRVAVAHGGARLLLETWPRHDLEARTLVELEEVGAQAGLGIVVGLVYLGAKVLFEELGGSVEVADVDGEVVDTHGKIPSP